MNWVFYILIKKDTKVKKKKKKNVFVSIFLTTSVNTKESELKF